MLRPPTFSRAVRSSILDGWGRRIGEAARRPARSAIGALATIVAAACGGGQATPAVSAPVAVQIPDARMLIATGDAGSPRATAAC
ncbi:MAG: hypothetical protein JWO86_2727, partial [Myxococcaceae bacterium]|nr:hypothetical protein [Myxococcaceae bacterium]